MRPAHRTRTQFRTNPQGFTPIRGITRIALGRPIR
jgi:hypothetical protein